jgi:hypothetical protein
MVTPFIGPFDGLDDEVEESLYIEKLGKLGYK